MSCNTHIPREVMQKTLKINNEHFLRLAEENKISDDAMRADGDTELGFVDYDMVRLLNNFIMRIERSLLLCFMCTAA